MLVFEVLYSFFYEYNPEGYKEEEIIEWTDNTETVLPVDFMNDMNGLLNIDRIHNINVHELNRVYNKYKEIFDDLEDHQNIKIVDWL